MFLHISAASQVGFFSPAGKIVGFAAYPESSFQAIKNPKEVTDVKDAVC